ncbi:hypothetical protein HAT93_00008 [Dickeya solani]|nr:hypothetical protein [Dickeya solani]
MNTNSNAVSAAFVLERIMSSYGVKTQKELSEVTEIPTNTISNWVQRGNVPGNIILKCALDTGADAGWLVTGEFANANVFTHKSPLKGKALYEQILSSGGKAVLRRMLDAYGFSTQKELGDLLGIAPGTISTWIRRDFFPGDVVVTCALDTGVSLAWLATGKGSPQQNDVPVSRHDDSGICLIPRNLLKTGKLQDAGSGRRIRSLSLRDYMRLCWLKGVRLPGWWIPALPVSAMVAGCWISTARAISTMWRCCRGVKCRSKAAVRNSSVGWMRSRRAVWWC